MKGQKYLSSKHRFTRQTSALLFRPPAGKPVCPDNAGNMRCLFINQTRLLCVSESLERLTNLLKMIHQKHTTLLKMTPPQKNPHHHYTMLSTTGIPRALEHKIVHSSSTQASKMQARPIYISCDPQQHVVILANQI